MDADDIKIEYIPPEFRLPYSGPNVRVISREEAERIFGKKIELVKDAPPPTEHWRGKKRP